MAEEYKKLPSVITMEAGSKGYGITSIEMSSHPANNPSTLSDSDPIVQELLLVVKEGNISKLKELLKDEQKSRQVNHIYRADNVRGSLLHVAAKAGDKRSELAELLIAHGANPKTRDVSGSKSCPIHYAADKLQPQMMKVLINGGANPNAREAHFGRTPLHIILKNWKQNENDKEFKECLDTLLEQHEKMNVDCQNDNQATPLFLALGRNCNHMVQKMIEYGANLENQLIKSTYPDYKTTFKQKENIKAKKIRHFGDELLDKGLKANDLTTFKTILSEIDSYGENKSAIINEDYGKTLLQYACDRGHTDFVVELLNNNADPLKEDTATLNTPLHYASRKGYYKMIEHLTNSMKTKEQKENGLQKKDKKGETALHKIAKQEYKSNEEGRNYEESFRILMKYQEYIFVDEQDDFGFTALHYAVQMEDDSIVRQLLLCGAHWGIKNDAENIAIKNINSEFLEELLDDCVCLKKHDSDFKKFEIELNYCMLVPSSKNMNGNAETERLMYLCNLRSHQSLLCHPIIDTFLHLKWQRIAPLYFINIVTYSIYLASLTAYSLIFYGTFRECDSSGPNSTEIFPTLASSAESYNTSTNHENSSAMNSKEHENESFNNFPLKIFLLSIICLYTIFITIREIVQCCVSWKLYIKRIENWLEISIVILSFAMSVSSDCKVQQSIIAWLILIAWTEFIFLLGYHPKLANYVNMFTKVSFNFLKFITMFSFMFIAFSLSFYLVFQMNDEFQTYPQSLLRTFAMSTGELEYTELPLSVFPPSSHLLYSIFIFLILLVLMNLLNGLAVSDISLLQKEAEIVSYQSRIELISYLESIFLSGFTSDRVKDLCCSRMSQNPLMKMASFLIPKGLMLQDCLDKQCVRLFPNQRKSEKWIICSGKNCDNHSKSNLDISHIDSALAVLQTAQNKTVESSKELTERIVSMDKTLNILQQQNSDMDTAMNFLKDQNENMNSAIKLLTEMVQKNALVSTPSQSNI